MKTLALNVLDIVQNSIKALATRISVEISESRSGDKLKIMVVDNGVGISSNMLEKVTDPFVTSRTTRNIGMGLPLLKYHANLTGGDLTIESVEKKGTTVIATFGLSHLDRQPLGDIAGVMTILIAANPQIDFIYRHKTDSGEYEFSTKETKEFLETETLNEYNLLNMIGMMISENLKEISVSI